jgi:hypothetical protein
LYAIVITSPPCKSFTTTSVFGNLQAAGAAPVHDWTSHAADSFRYLAMTLDGRAAQSGFHRRIPYASHGIE